MAPSPSSPATAAAGRRRRDEDQTKEFAKARDERNLEGGGGSVGARVSLWEEI